MPNASQSAAPWVVPLRNFFFNKVTADPPCWTHLCQFLAINGNCRAGIPTAPTHLQHRFGVWQLLPLVDLDVGLEKSREKGITWNAAHRNNSKTTPTQLQTGVRSREEEDGPAQDGFGQKMPLLGWPGSVPGGCPSSTHSQCPFQKICTYLCPFPEGEGAKVALESRWGELLTNVSHGNVPVAMTTKISFFQRQLEYSPQLFPL